MFTGIVEELGQLRSAATDGAVTRLTFGSEMVSVGVGIGDSIAVNGACLTVVERGEGWWAADAVAETLARTNLGLLDPGDPVNLERPMTPDGRLGGHLVQGHVDGVGRVVSPAPDLVVAHPPELGRYLVPKGSVTVDGCSLTVVEVTATTFSVAVIPHTSGVTTLGHKAAGAVVNLEADVIAKYVERLLGAGAATPYGASGRGPSPA